MNSDEDAALRPIAEQPPVPSQGPKFVPDGSASVDADDPAENDGGRGAASVLVDHLFAPKAQVSRGIEYAIQYKLAEGEIGGDLVDVYGFDNGSVSFTAADIAGKGRRAAVHAALVKFSIRAFASEGYSAEKVIRGLNRLYVETCAFERVESFCTVFFAHADERREIFSYVSAAHEAAFFIPAGGEVQHLPVTAPIVGIFETQTHLFHQRFVPISPGSVLVVASDGIADAHDAHGVQFGLDAVREIVRDYASGPMSALTDELVRQAVEHTGRGPRDDMTALGVRFL